MKCYDDDGRGGGGVRPPRAAAMSPQPLLFLVSYVFFSLPTSIRESRRSPSTQRGRLQ